MQKIEAIIREQFSLEMKNKEHEIEVISQVTAIETSVSYHHIMLPRMIIISVLFINLFHFLMYDAATQ